MVRNRSMPVSRLEGPTRTGRAAVLLAGSSHTAELLTRRLFAGEVQTSHLATVPVWRVDSYLRKRAREGELIMICVGKLSAGLFFRPDCLRVPDAIDVGLKVPEEIETLWRSNHSLKEDIRLVNRGGMQMSLSQTEADFDLFYRTMYLPFIAGRHGDMARPRDENWLRAAFLRGGIIWVVRGEEKLAGVVMEIADGALHLWTLATRDGDPGLMKKGALAALYLYAIRHARDEGCSYVDFGSCRAFLADGILRYKRKWGMEVRPRPDNQNLVLIRWPEWNDAVSGFLADASLVHQDGQALKIVTATGQSGVASQADANRVHRSVFIPGIDRVVIVNSAGWEENVVAPGSTVLTEGSPSAGELAKI
jgi:GNAT acetyltransferase-like protein